VKPAVFYVLVIAEVLAGSARSRRAVIDFSQVFFAGVHVVESFSIHFLQA
jgi:hypothetical protein